MAPTRARKSVTSETGSDSGSDSDTSRSRSVSPAVSLNQGPVPTPGYSLDQHSRSNSPVAYATSNSPQSGPRSPHEATSRSASQSPASHRTNSPEHNTAPASPAQSAAADSGSNSPNLQIDADSQRDGSVSPTDSQASAHSQGSRGSVRSRQRSRSGSPASTRATSASPAHSQGTERSHRSGSRKSRSRSRSVPHSPSPESFHSGHKSRSRSRSPSRSHKSKSHSPAGSAKSVESNKTRTTSRSRANSASSIGSKPRSRSPSPTGSVRSPASNKTGGSHHSRSRSHSPAESHVSNKSAKSQKSDKSKGDGAQAMSEGSDIEAVPKRKRDDLSADSGSDTNKEKKKIKSGVIDSESSDDDDGNKKESVTADALFGDADDISSEEEKARRRDSDSDSDRRRDSDRARSDDDRRRSSDEEDGEQAARAGITLEDYEDQEPEAEPIPETRIDVEIPKISIDLGRELHFVKLPNFLSVETRPFDKETYEDEIDEEETLDEEGRARLKLKVENTIRWREVFDRDGNAVKESNARIVKWSDGSMSLHLGSEIFDVYKQPLQGDHNHLFIRQGTGLQGQAVFRNKLTFRPHSTESFTHRKMTMSLADRSQKTSGIKILSQVGQDPDQDRKWNLKKEEEKLRQAMRTSRPLSKPKRSRDPARGAAFREDEGSEDEGAISIAAIKNKFNKPKNGAAAANAAATAKSTGAIYSSDEEGSDLEAHKSKKTDKSRALQDSDEASGEEDGGNDSDANKSDEEEDDD